MKKTLIALIALAGVSFAQDDITLRYLIDCNTYEGGQLSFVNAATEQYKGSTEIISEGFCNYTSSTMDGSSYATTASRANNWKIEDADGINDGTADGVLNTDKGFTITFNGYATSGQNWKDFLSFTIGGQQYKFELNGGSDLFIYNKDLGTGSPYASVSNVSKGNWYNYAVSVLGSSYTFSVFNMEGELVSSATTVTNGATGNLTGIYNCSNFDSHNSDKYYIDNIAIYDGVLSEKQISQLTKDQVAGKGTTQSFAVVPEPATATLSLLALCGLAARRRRK